LTEEYSWLQVAPLEPEVMLLDAGKVTSLADCMVWRGASETSPATCGLSEVAISAILLPPVITIIIQLHFKIMANLTSLALPCIACLCRIYTKIVSHGDDNANNHAL